MQDEEGTVHQILPRIASQGNLTAEFQCGLAVVGGNEFRDEEEDFEEAGRQSDFVPPPVGVMRFVLHPPGEGGGEAVRGALVVEMWRFGVCPGTCELKCEIKVSDRQPLAAIGVLVVNTAKGAVLLPFL